MENVWLILTGPELAWHIYFIAIGQQVSQISPTIRPIAI